ncbi:MAG: S9 family peptidase [Geminicoccaceae bacterium]|nr:S9 family peptidase [Geminicoccaceae bacterium]
MQTPPSAEPRPLRLERHGVAWTDDYAWLRDPAYPEVKDPRILAYLEAENAWYEAATAPWRGFVDGLHAELKGRIKDEDASVPAPDGPFLYHWMFRAGAQYRTWCRRPRGGGEAEVVFDENAAARGKGYFQLRALAPSPDHRRLAYAVDEDGSERYALHVHDLDERLALAEAIPDTSGAVAWSADGKTLLYVELNERLRPFRVQAHRLGDGGADAVLFEEDDPAFFVSVRRTLSRRFVVVHSGSHETHEAWLLDAADPFAPLRLVAPRLKGRRLQVEHQAGHQAGHGGGRLVVLTNDRHENFRLVEAPVDGPGPESWREVVAGSDRRYWQGLVAFERHVVLRGRIEAEDAVVVLGPDGGERRVAFDEPLLSIEWGENREHGTATLRLVVSSLKTPRTVVDLDLDTHALAVRKVQEIPSGYDPDRFETRRLWATAPDGQRVPVSVVHEKGHPRDGSRPLLLYGYGAYGHGMETAFAPSRLTLLERGFAYAIAHVRGGDELGQRWYREGRLEGKPNSFSDFVAAAEALVREGYARPGRIAARGGSAGGMLMGAVANLRPDLWGCLVLEVPFVDVLNTMLDDTLPLTPIEWPEWGDPIQDPTAFARIRGYSPYDNVGAKDYPPMLVTAGISDPRVTYWEPAKYVARLRARRTNDAPLFLKTNMGAGHFGASGRFDALRELAEAYGFVLRVMGR